MVVHGRKGIMILLKIFQQKATTYRKEIYSDLSARLTDFTLCGRFTEKLCTVTFSFRSVQCIKTQFVHCIKKQQHIDLMEGEARDVC
jgi:hypothetical protein